MVVPTIDATVVFYTLGVYAAIVISPGPNFALVSRLALQGRRRTCWGAILGLALAATVYAVLAMIGLAALLTEIGWLARGVQVAGGLYLIYLGLKGWRASAVHGAETDLTTSSRSGSIFAGMRIGVLVNLSNPKAIAFFIGLYAVAVPPDSTFETRAAILAGGAFLEVAWYGIVLGILSRGPFRRAYQAGAKWIERAIGSVLIIFGARLVLDK